jgi:2-oxoglutarate ferredoxin oxidoreductase subunit delta
MSKIEIKKDVCKGCGLCAEFCPKKIITIGGTNLKGYSYATVFDVDKCIACCSCAIMCPDGAITIT